MNNLLSPLLTSFLKSSFATILNVVALGSMYASAQAPKAAWHLDLTTEQVLHDRSKTDFRSIAFVDNATLIVQAEFQGASERPPDTGSKTEIRHGTALFAVTARSGTVQHSQTFEEWSGLPAMLRARVLYPTGTPDILLNVGDDLLSISPTLEILAKRKLPLNRRELNGHPQQDDWQLLTDPKAKKAVLIHFPFPPSEPGQGSWISLDTLQDQDSISLPRWNGAALIDDSIVFNDAPRSVKTAKKGDLRLKEFCKACLGTVRDSFGNGLVFVAMGSYWIVNSDGAVIYKGRLSGKEDKIDAVSGAATANRVAFITAHLGQGLENTVTVLDCDSKKEIMRIKFQQQPRVTSIGNFVKQSLVTPKLALSPDGKQMALLVEGVISLFDVP